MVFCSLSLHSPSTQVRDAIKINNSDKKKPEINQAFLFAFTIQNHLWGQIRGRECCNPPHQ